MMVNVEHDLKECLSALRAGGIILYPTDTVWGLGCDATNEKAVEKIYAIKQRTETKALIVLVAEEKDILQYTAAVDLSLFDYLDAQAEPTTVIYEHGLGFAANLTPEDGSIAIRICRDQFCQSLIKRFGKPIVSTSANISGNPAPGIFKEIQPEIIRKADYVVRHRQDDSMPHRPSSIIRWENGKPVKIR